MIAVERDATADFVRECGTVTCLVLTYVVATPSGRCPSCGSLGRPVMATTFVTLEQIAERADVLVDTARTMHKRSTRNRAAGTVRPGDLPAPDVVLGKTPGWATTTIDTWIQNRPRARRNRDDA